MYQRYPPESSCLWGVVEKGGKAKRNELNSRENVRAPGKGHADESERMVKKLSHGDREACDKDNIVQRRMR